MDGLPPVAPRRNKSFSKNMRAADTHMERLQRLGQALQAQVKGRRFYPVVEVRQALRRVQFTVAVTTVAKCGALTRLENPGELMKFLGLIPSEYSTGIEVDRAPLPKLATPMPDGH